MYKTNYTPRTSGNYPKYAKLAQHLKKSIIVFHDINILQSENHMIISIDTKKDLAKFNTFCYCSVTQSCLTLCDPVGCSMPGFPVFYCLLEFVQTHVHRVSDVIQPSHPLCPSSSPALNYSSIRVFSNELALHIR